MSATTSKTKALVFQHLLSFAEDRFGKQAAAELRALPLWQQIGLEPTAIQISSWIPTGAWSQLLEEMTERCLDGDPVRCAEFGAYFLERDLRGVYRVFLMVTSTSFLLRAIPSIWRAYNTSGTSLVLERSATHGVLSLEDYSHPSPHEWHMVAGATVRALELAGGRNVRHEILDGLGPMNRRLEIRVDWD